MSSLYLNARSVQREVVEGHGYAPLLQESLRVDHVLANSARLPRPEGTGRVDLVQTSTPVAVPTSHEQRNAEWTDTAMAWTRQSCPATRGVERTSTLR